MKVPFLDLSIMHEKLKDEMLRAYEGVLKRSDFILGEDVREFEKEFARFCSVDYAAGISSGTDALFIALKALGIGPGDEVVVPSFTYIASALAVSFCGARVVFADIDEKTYNLDPRSLAEVITGKTKAVIPVHLYGQPADMREIMKICRERTLKVVEDAAQAHGARIRMHKDSWMAVGGIGDAGCFSFYPTKNLGALGDGGMITTADRELYERILMLRDYGRVSKYEHALIGYNTRLDTVQAAFLRIKLGKLGEYNRMRREAAAVYTRLLRDLDGVTTPFCADGLEHVYHVYAVRLKRRDRVYQALLDNGVGAIIHYPIPVHLQKAYSDLQYKRGDFPVSERVSTEILSLPIFPYITREQIEYVVGVIKKA